jgi:hypothetical protein
MFSLRKKRVASNVLADVLVSEFIMNKNENARFNLDGNWKPSVEFENKVVCYKLALVILALLAAEQKDSRFEKVKTNLERLVFSPDVVEGMPFFLQVKSAMDNLSELLNVRINAGESMLWASRWLEEAGINENNPALNLGFALMWIDNYVTIGGYLKECKPE